MAVGMAVATMGRDDAAAGEECAGSDELPDEAWREITVAEGSQGPRSYMFSAQRAGLMWRHCPFRAEMASLGWRLTSSPDASPQLTTSLSLVLNFYCVLPLWSRRTRGMGSCRRDHDG